MTCSLKENEWEKIYCENINQKKDGGAIVIPEKKISEQEILP